MTRRLRAAAGLAALYAVTLASADPVDLAVGAVLGGALAVLVGDRLRLGPAGALPGFARRAAWFPVFAAAVLAEVLVGTWEVASRVLHLRRLDRPGIIRVPVGERSDRGVAVSALATTLSPGTVLIDVDWERRDMLLHVIDASDPDAARERLQRFYDRYQRRVFP